MTSYYLQNKKKFQERSKREYERDKEKAKKRSRLWAKNNPERYNEIKKRWSDKRKLKTSFKVNINIINKGIKTYYKVMSIYHTHKFRRLTYGQLRTDFEEIQRIRIAA